MFGSPSQGILPQTCLNPLFALGSKAIVEPHAKAQEDNGEPLLTPEVVSHVRGPGLVWPF